MRGLLLFLWLSVQTGTTLFAKPIPLQEALQQGLVQLKADGQGGHLSQALKVSFQNTGKRALELSIPAGFIFNATDSTFQDLIVAKEKVLSLEKGTRKSALLTTFCIRAHRASPLAGLAFASGGLATGALLQLAQYIQEKGLYESPQAQHAIWAVSNGHGLEGIGHPELAKFTAKLLGKPEPAYHIQYAETSQPGEQAFRNEPIAVSGTFEYENLTDITATFALYNDQGERVFTFFENELRKPGKHRFRFNFKTNRLPQGQYMARLTDANGNFVGGVPIRL